MRFHVLSVVAALLFVGPALAKSQCPTDDLFRSNDWQVHSTSQFKALAEVALERLESEEEHFVEESSGTIYSSVASRMLRAWSLDDLRTPHDEMFGDLLLLTDLEDQLVEVRWYRAGKKHVVYDTSGTPCATRLIPMAVNSLY